MKKSPSRPRPWGWILALAAYCLLAPLAAGAQTGEFLLSQPSQGSQYDPSVAGLAGGGFACAWTSGGGDQAIPFLRLYDPQGRSAGDATALGSQGGNPRVAGLSGGGLVAVWETREAIWARLLGPDGAALSDAILVHQTSDSALDLGGLSQVAGLAEGGFVVVWQETSGGDCNVFGRSYSAGGAPYGERWLVNGGTSGRQYGPQVAGLAEGGLAVVWRSDQVAGNGAYATYLRTFNAQGVPISGDVELFGDHGDLGSLVIDPNLAALPSGGLAVVTSRRNCGDSACQQNNLRVYGRLYDNQAQATGGDFMISPDSYDYQADQPVIAATPDGGLTAIWRQSEGGERFVIMGQRLDSLGGASGGVLVVNGGENWLRSDPRLAGDASGAVMAVWKSWQQDGGDYGIYGRVY